MVLIIQVDVTCFHDFFQWIWVIYWMFLFSLKKSKRTDKYNVHWISKDSDKLFVSQEFVIVEIKCGIDGHLNVMFTDLWWHL